MSELNSTSKKKPLKRVNYVLTKGLMRYTKSSNQSKKRHLRKKNLNATKEQRFERRKKLKENKKTRKIEKEKVVPKNRKYIVKEIGGQANGTTRKVLIRKPAKFYPIVNKIKTKKKRFACNPNITTNFRSSLTPGTICIIVLPGKMLERVVFLKGLKSGRIVVCGPRSLNGCSFLPICATYVIATSTKIDLGSDFPSLDNIDDNYFKKEKKSKKSEDIFEKETKKSGISEEKRNEQKIINKALLGLISAHPESKMLKRYLKARFFLKDKDYPHLMKF